ncbi:hypothetical protein GCM10028820_02470 [Tessaracoccus terricola]
MGIDVALLAGTVSSVIFAVSVLPMVLKAVRTHDLSSYSPGNLALANVGNLVHSVYVFSLPAGPIWVLHSFYLVTTALMLVLYLTQPRPSSPEVQQPDDDVAVSAAELAPMT